jgi:hypothetical protein
MRSLYRQGPLSQILKQTYGSQDPERVVRRFALDLQVSSGITGPPFNPRDFARALNIPVEYAPIEAEGVYTNRSLAQSVFRASARATLADSWSTDAGHVVHDGPAIFLREPSRITKSLKARENFTLAHEIGHCVIRAALSGAVPSDFFLTENPEEEAWCNIFAEELLIPTKMLYRDLAYDRLAPRALTDLSHRYGVSLQALLCRVIKLFFGKVVAVIRNTAQGYQTVEWSCPRKFQAMVLCQTGRTTVERAFRSMDHQEGKDEILVNGQRFRWDSVSQQLKGSGKILTIMRRPFNDLQRTVRFSIAKERAALPLISRPITPIQQMLPFE